MTSLLPTTPESEQVVSFDEATWRTRVAPTVRALRRRVPAEAVVGGDVHGVRLDALDGGPCEVPLGRFVVITAPAPA